MQLMIVVSIEQFIFSVSEQLLFNIKWAIFQLYNGKNKLDFDDGICLYHAELHLIVLAHWSSIPQTDILLHLTLYPTSSQPVFILSGEVTNISLYDIPELVVPIMIS